MASECHRIARLGLDRNLEEEEEELKLSAQARARVADSSNNNEVNGKYVVDIFGQTHPPVASEIFECMNCGRAIAAGRFAPHLEKCMGKVSCSLTVRCGILLLLNYEFLIIISGYFISLYMIETLFSISPILDFFLSFFCYLHLRAGKLVQK